MPVQDLQGRNAQRREAAVTGSATDCSWTMRDTDALMLPLAADERQALSEPAGEACQGLELYEGSVVSWALSLA